MQSKSAPAAEKFKRGKIHDVVVYALNKFVDERGWLAELFRHYQLDREFYPPMVYLSSTEPGITRVGRTSMWNKPICSVLSGRQTLICGFGTIAGNLSPGIR